MTVAEKLITIAENVPIVYQAGRENGYNEGANIGYAAGYANGYDDGKAEGGGIDTSDATATAEDIDYDKTAYVNGVKITGAKHRREYRGTIDADKVGATEYVALLTDSLLAEIRTLDTLFVRVESDTQAAGSVVKTWANNGYLNVMPSYNSNTQTVHRLTSAGAANISGNSETLYSTSVDSKVGLVNITEDGELRWYSGSTGAYKIRQSNFRVIVEW